MVSFVEEGSLPDELLAGQPASAAAVSVRAQPPRRGGVRNWKARAVHPGCLLAVGAALLAVGAALIATPLALRGAARHTAAPAPPPAVGSQTADAAGLDAEGVPLDATGPLQQQDGELLDCGVALPNREAYEAAAAAAETTLLGAPAATLPPDQLQAAAGSLPPLLVGTVFWVLVSDSHPWSSKFSAAAAAQVETLNAAFKGLNITFRLDAVVAAPVPDDAVVEQCSARWGQLTAQLLPSARPAAQSTEASSGGDQQGDPTALHVIVCEPEGVRGAAAVLGGGGGAGPDGAAAGSILLRRSALWLSQTSLAHQVGHFLGLPHPFPDGRQTCKLDGDAIHDTPRQYAPNQGCNADKNSDLHVCLDSADGPLPTINIMDLTNDTCRYHFTPGQGLRMQAMLRALRPRLYAAAAAQAEQLPLVVLEVEAAWQSGLPPAGVQQQQQAAFVARQERQGAAAAAATGSGAAGSSVPRPPAGAADAATLAGSLFGDPWSQAALAADGQLSGSLDECACLGPDGEGHRFWTGQLNASYTLDAVRLLLPVQLDDSASEGSGDSGSRGGGAASSLGAAPSSAPASEHWALAAGSRSVQVDVWVGDSLDHTQNQRCLPSPSPSDPSSAASGLTLPLGQPLHSIACQPPAAGRYVTVALAAALQAGSQAGAAQQAQQLCLCEVQPLAATPFAVTPAASQSSSSNSAGSSAAGGWRPLAAVPLNITADMAASQFGDTGGRPARASAAGAALARPPPRTPAGSSAQLARPACSSSSGGRAAWWSLDAGLDGAWVHGVRLSVPFACQLIGSMNSSGSNSSSSGSSGSSSSGVAGADCLPVPDAKLSVYVGDTPPVQLVGAAVAARDARERDLCAAAVSVPPGLPAELRCEQFMHGRYITVVAAAQGQPAPLSLCGLQLLGATELLLSQHMARLPAGQGPAQVAAPPELQPFSTLPMDGDSSSCLEAPALPSGGAGAQASTAGAAGSASWQLQLDGSYPLLAVRLAALAMPPPASPAGGNSSQLAVSLLEAGGGAVATWTPMPAQLPTIARNASGSSRDSGSSREGGSSRCLMWELPAATRATAVRVEGFGSLCEVQLLAAAQ